jgi:zinc transport system ATP-binding protein
LPEPAVIIRDLTVAYDGNIVLEDINLEVARGEIMSVVGPNGSGKSTLLRAIMGFKRPAKGSILVLGRSPDEIQKTGLIGYLPQNMNYDQNFPVSAFDIVAMSRYSRKGIERLGPEDRAAINGSLEKVKMQSQTDKHFGSLSGGQKQRVLIARALAMKPSILILDEPSIGLDVVAQDSFYRLLQKLRDDEGLTIILVSHDIGGVSGVVDKIACVKRQMHFYGSPKDCIPSTALEKTFGTNVYFLSHDSECGTCRRDK